MKAAAIAEMLRARRRGPERWVARCPAHEDRSPSLNIAAGRDGRVLVRCWAGCSTDAIVKAIGLRMADLFEGPPPKGDQARKIAQERIRSESKTRAKRKAHVAICDRLQKLEAICPSLGMRLALEPDNDKLAELFHTALDNLRTLEHREMELRP